MTVFDAPPLAAGDHLDQPTFHARCLAMPEGTRAELVEGSVYTPPPVGEAHSAPHGDLAFWLHYYRRSTPGVVCMTAGTAILGPRSEPQPDAALRVRIGGQTRSTDDGYVSGCPESVCEVAERHGAREYVAVVVQTPAVVWCACRGKRLVEVRPDRDGLYRSRTFPGLWLHPDSLLANDA